MVDPAAQSERVIAAAHKVPRTLYFCPSPLYGYGLVSFLEMMSADSVFLCVEADERLMNFTLGEIFPELLLHPRFRLVSTKDPQALCTYIKNEWGARAFRRVETIRISGGWQLSPEIYEALLKAIQRDIAIDWGNAATLMNLGRRYALNFIRNLPLLSSSPSAEFISFGEKPLLVLGAGPSLDEVLESFPAHFAEKEHRPFGIIAVDTALSALKARNIQPDLAAALEAQHWNLRDFIGLGDWRIPLAMDLSALPALSGQWENQLFLFMTPWTELSIFQRLKDSGFFPLSMPPLGSVGLTAALLALKVSSGTVISAGLDFSFTFDAFHAKETPSWRDLRRKHNRFNSIIPLSAVFRRGVSKSAAKNASLVFTDTSLQHYRDLFEQEFAAETRLIDINSSGLPLGIKTVTFQEAMYLLSEKHTGEKTDFSASISSIHEKNGERLARITQFIREEHQSLAALRSMLTGEKKSAPDEWEDLLYRCNYLWAHFPDYAGTSGKRPAVNDLSFLKRVRTEIEPFLKLFERITEPV